MNDVEFYTKAVDIILQLDEYDGKDFDVIIQTDANEMKVTTVTPHDVARTNFGKNACRVGYIGLNYFSLDSLKIACKYPVTVKCDDFIISKHIEPIADKELWKIGYKENYNALSCSGVFEPKKEDKESDIRELTTSEAEEWLQQFHKDKPYAGLFRLYHKKYGEWILYKDGK